MSDKRLGYLTFIMILTLFIHELFILSIDSTFSSLILQNEV